MRALDRLLDYVVGHATADGVMPGDVLLRLVADVLTVALATGRSPP
ncbi:hypothetical protein GTU99_20625 [Streptomyces sp. PRKS01-65]|nr:hypothetical protein [Streptomyces harenosi]NEY34575.1 hypothetical protein [Streptomyces harenosi]